MLPYLFLITLVSFCSVLDYVKLNTKSRKILLVLLIGLLIMFCGTRFETGNDWTAYVDTFNRIPPFESLCNNPEMFVVSRMEPGYVILNSIVKSLGGTLDIVFLISCIITVGLLFIALNRYSFFCFLAILLYMRYGYLQANMMFVRQGIAVSIFFISLKYVEERKFWQYIAINIIAILFHSSLYIVLPLYFFLNRRYSNRTIIGFVIISILLSFVNIVGTLNSYLPSFISESIMEYSKHEVWGGMTGKINIALIEKFILLLLCLKYRNRLSENKSFNLFLNIFVLSIICYYSFFQMYIFQQRLVFIFQLSTIGIWVLLLRSSTKETQKWLTLALNILVVYFFLHYVFTSANVFIPYRSWIV